MIVLKCTRCCREPLFDSERGGPSQCRLYMTRIQLQTSYNLFENLFFLKEGKRNLQIFLNFFAIKSPCFYIDAWKSYKKSLTSPIRDNDARAAATTRSAVKPNCSNNTLYGALAP